MRAKKILRSSILAAFMLTLGYAHAQVSVLGHVPTTPGTDYVGWDNTTNVPLMVRHNNNQPIEWYTNAIARMRLNQNVTGTLNTFTNINRDGFTLISGTADAFTNAGSRAPFTRLHLVDEAVNPTQPNVYAQQLGFRPWQRNGVTFTGNSDQGYVGQKYAGDDNTDMVIQWSHNPGVIRPRPKAMQGLG